MFVQNSREARGTRLSSGESLYFPKSVASGGVAKTKALAAFTGIRYSGKISKEKTVVNFGRQYRECERV